jgi:hypothetical protein
MILNLTMAVCSRQISQGILKGLAKHVLKKLQA